MTQSVTRARRGTGAPAPAKDTDAGLEQLRSRLDEVDGRLLECLRDRVECCASIARHKRAHGVPMMQPSRIDVVQERAARFGRENRVDLDYLRRVYALIIDEMCRIEDEVISAPDAHAEEPA